MNNYRSLVDFSVDLTGKRGAVKKLVLIYGENGVGKSNFAHAFCTLYETLRTKSVKDILENLLKHPKDVDGDITLKKFMQENFKDIESIIKTSKTISSSENMVLEFGVRINGKNGVYRLEMDDKRIVAERLEYVINKNKTVFFDISEEKAAINEKIFRTAEYKEEITSLVEQYWGKHSFLSLLVAEVEDKKEGYVKGKICKGLFEIMAYFMTLSFRVRDGYRVERGKMGIAHEILGDLEKGTIELENISELEKAEQFLNEFFTSLYSDVKQVYYDKKIKESKVEYHLVFKKQLYNKLVDIDFSCESTGTQHLLGMVPFFMASVEGQTVILDEMDTGIHDLLVDSILENLYDSVKGQIIITTHNTMLLESELPKDSMYVFNVDSNSNKELLPISTFEERIHPNLNMRKRYLKGMYGGIPSMMDVDFSELLDIIE